MASKVWTLNGVNDVPWDAARRCEAKALAARLIQQVKRKGLTTVPWPYDKAPAGTTHIPRVGRHVRALCAYDIQTDKYRIRCDVATR